LLAATPPAQAAQNPVPKDPLTSKSAQKQTPTAKPATGIPGSQAPQSTRSSTAKPATAKTNSGELGAEKQGGQGPKKPGTKPKKAPSGKPKKQQPRALRRNFERLTTPDGSRFHLIQDPTVAHIHWAIAAWADGRDDPPGLPGLTLATAQASLAGTWTTGSSDPQAEREALTKLDAAWQQQLAKPGDRTIAALVIQLDQEAAKLGDRRMFERLLAAAPALHPEVLDRAPLTVFALTTTEPAIETVARLILERREEQVLRGLARAWVPSVLARLQDHAMHPRRRMYAEVLALLMPSSPAIAHMEAPPVAAPNRNSAMAAWQASQHPANTVHILIGNFDPTYLKNTLNLVFAETKLVAPKRRQTTPRPLRGQRRSIVPGIASGGGTIAWVLPPITDPTELELARRWLMDKRGPLHRALDKKRPNLVIDCRAPWPITTNGQSLLLLDIQDPKGKPGVVNEVLEICATITAKPFHTGLFYKTFLQLSREWNSSADSPRSIAIMLAERALVWPSVTLDQLAPRHHRGEDIHPILKAVFGSYPAIVEAK
jgi:hypothetical protein